MVSDSSNTYTGGIQRRTLRVCVLHSSLESSNGVFVDVDPYCKPEAYDAEGEYEWGNEFIHKATSGQQVAALAASGKWDVYLNLCDGAFDEDRAGKDVVEALERCNLAYTGADLTFYEPSKVEMKAASHYYGVKIPAWVHIQSGRVVEGLAACLAPQGGLRFPLIVKHPSGYGSIGMTRDSKVTCEEQLRVQVDKFISEFGGALVEEFIEGREFTVLVVEHYKHLQAAAANGNDHAAGAEPGAGASASEDVAGANTAAAAAPDLSHLGLRVDPSAAPELVAYVPVECVFAAGETFKHFDLKWVDYDAGMSWRPCDEVGADANLAQALRRAAIDTFIATRGVSYGRCDFRVDAEGNVYLLEINPNCGVLYPPGLHGSADYILTLDQRHNHKSFIRGILEGALERHRRRQPLCVPYFQPGGANGGSFRLLASRDIRVGEVVQRNERRATYVASRHLVQRIWPEGSRQRGWFHAYAYPFGPGVYDTWSDDPADWKPINHHCDPNAWLQGLDLVARRDIKKGEEVVADYGTFYADDEPEDADDELVRAAQALLAPTASGGSAAPIGAAAAAKPVFNIMPAFECSCGAACCRGTVTGKDYLLPVIGETYGKHISPYVAAARKRHEARAALRAALQALAAQGRGLRAD